MVGRRVDLRIDTCLPGITEVPPLVDGLWAAWIRCSSLLARDQMDDILDIGRLGDVGDRMEVAAYEDAGKKYRR